MFFRRNPFGGEFTVFAGVEECIRYIANFKFTEAEIDFVRDAMPGKCEVTAKFKENQFWIRVNLS